MTDRAVRYLCESLTRKKEGAPEALRIVHIEEEGYQLTLDDAKDGDQLFEQEGVRYLILDTEMIEALADATVDVEESAMGRRLTLTGGKTLTPSEPETAESEPADTEPAGPESEPKTKA